MTRIILRDILESDLRVFFAHQRAPAANRMAPFTAKDPNDESAVLKKRRGLLGNTAIPKERSWPKEGSSVTSWRRGLESSSWPGGAATSNRAPT